MYNTYTNILLIVTLLKCRVKMSYKNRVIKVLPRARSDSDHDQVKLKTISKSKA